MNSSDNTSVNDVSKYLDNLYADENYRKVAKAIEGEFIMAKDKLFDQNGKLIDSCWKDVTEPVKLKGKDWKVKIFTSVTGVDVLGRPTMFTLVRIVPPLEYKEILRTGDKESEIYRNIIVNYTSSFITGEDIGMLKLDLIRSLNEVVYPNRDYNFLPMKDMYGLLPQYDFDVILPFISITSFKGEI